MTTQHTDDPTLARAEQDQAADPVFQAEQAHLDQTYDTLVRIGHAVAKELDHVRAEAAEDKKSMAEELMPDFGTYTDAMETYAEFSAMNRIIDDYNLAQDANSQKLADIQRLMEQPYFAKVSLRFKPGAEPKEVYIGNVGMSDENYRRLIVDWRSPVAETYYNQDNGPTSYEANGRTINADLLCRRQFDITRNKLNAYFDTSVAIQDSLLLASLSKQRSAHMQAITATIQKEQNVVVRHEDVPVMLVNGIAGSGKTSVLLQRIAYLFYQRRDDLTPQEVFLITPNEVFGRYIEHVLPELGERNPHTLTWNEFARGLMPATRSIENANDPIELLWRIEELMDPFEFKGNDFRDIACKGTTFVSATHIAKIADKFSHITNAQHRITLMKEEIFSRVQGRFTQLSKQESTQLEIAALSIQDQLTIFGETTEGADEEKSREYAQTYLHHRYAEIDQIVDNDEWLRIDRIGMRLLGVEHLDTATWLYLRMALTGLANADAKYVMIDEVQDYSAMQLAVLARYFKRAHFMLLGDENQAIRPGTASFAQIEDVFTRMRGSVARCSLMTSYRSAPQVTNLFSGLLDEEERAQVESIQRAEDQSSVTGFTDQAEWEAGLRAALKQAELRQGTTAVVVPWKDEAKRLKKILGDAAPRLLDNEDSLPESGVMMLTLGLAKGLEFDHVIIPNAIERFFPDEPLGRRRLYTTISRATHGVTILADGALTPLLTD